MFLPAIRTQSRSAAIDNKRVDHPLQLPTGFGNVNRHVGTPQNTSRATLPLLTMRTSQGTPSARTQLPLPMLRSGTTNLPPRDPGASLRMGSSKANLEDQEYRQAYNVTTGHRADGPGRGSGENRFPEKGDLRYRQKVEPQQPSGRKMQSPYNAPAPRAPDTHKLALLEHRISSQPDTSNLHKKLGGVKVRRPPPAAVHNRSSLTPLLAFKDMGDDKLEGVQWDQPSEDTRPAQPLPFRSQ